MPVMLQQMDQFPDVPNTLLRARFEPKYCPARVETFGRCWQVGIKPVEDFPYVLPLFRREITRVEEPMRRHKHALWLVGIVVNSSCDETEVHRYIAAKAFAALNGDSIAVMRVG